MARRPSSFSAENQKYINHRQYSDVNICGIMPAQFIFADGNKMGGTFAVFTGPCKNRKRISRIIS